MGMWDKFQFRDFKRLACSQDNMFVSCGSLLTSIAFPSEGSFIVLIVDEVPSS
jgi:hypothetical protein